MKKKLLLIILMFSFTTLFAQQRTIRGSVVDGDNSPIPGAIIKVKETSKGTSADANGKFQLAIPSDTKTLVCSFLGMKAKEIVLDASDNYVVVLEYESNELKGVTVVAFGTQKKESVLGSITTIRPAELKGPSSNLTTSLAGRMAGLISYQRSGEPGEDNAAFFIRGVTSFTYASGPMILIDGVEMTTSDLARMQPDDIASFSIMKDATAGALYGARGANGVILVTTKEGTEGQAKISVRYESSLSKATRNIEFADPITYMNLNNEAVLTRDPLGIAPYSQEKIDKTMAGANPMVYPANDWQKLLLQDHAINSRLNFNLSGGGKIARYYIAATYNQDNGTLKMDKKNNFNNNINLKKYQLHSNVNINVTKSTEVIARLLGTFDDYSGPLTKPTDPTMAAGTYIYKQIMGSDPVLFPAFYNPDINTQTKHYVLFGNYDLGQYVNPYADMVKGYREYSKSTLMAQFELKQNLDFITPGLKLRGLYSTTRYSFFDIQRSYQPFYYALDKYDKLADSYTLTALNPTTGTEYLNYNQGGNKSVNSTSYYEAAINYDRSISKTHNFSGLLVATARDYLNGNAIDLISSLPKRNSGVSGRFTYNYDLRYFTEFNFGYNGSERFAAKNRFGFFPSIGGGWIVSNEKFWGESLNKVVNLLKLKATYGMIGNDNISDSRFFYLSNVDMNDGAYGYTFGNEFGYSFNGISISQYPNELITWEKSKKMNLGLETKLFKAINISAEYYTENRTNILMNRSNIPASMGLMATPQSNVGEAKSHGFDLSIDANKSFNENFWLTGRVNITYAVSEYTKFEDVDRSLTPWLYRIGQSTTQSWGYLAERLFVDDNEAANAPTQFGKYGAGDIKYRDINNDGVINTDDRVPIGYPTMPEIIYGFGISSGYKGFDFSCFFQGLARESFWIDASATAPFIDNDGISGTISKNALLKAYADSHWSENDRNLYALWPRLSDVSSSNNTQPSTWFMRDGTFLRLKALEFGYTIPAKTIKPMHITNCRFYFTGTNLLTFSKFKLWDPEMAGNGLAYPVQKVFNIGLQISF